MSRRVVIPPVLDELKELFGPALLKEAHERAPDGLHLGRRHFGDPAVAVDERGRDLLELEIAEDVGPDENLDELARGNDEFGHEVDRPRAVLAVLGRRRRAGPEVLVRLVAGQGQGQRSAKGSTDAACSAHRCTWV